MTFGYDICTFLLNNHEEWDDTVVTDGFEVYLPATITEEVIGEHGGNLNISSTSAQNLETVTKTTTSSPGKPRKANIYQTNATDNQELATDVIYLNQQPNSKNSCICVFDSGGTEASRYHGTCMPMEQPSAQIKVRHESLRTAEDTALRIYYLLDELYHVTINDREYMSINAVAPPYYLGADQVTTAGQAHTYTLNLYGKLIRT